MVAPGNFTHRIKRISARIRTQGLLSVLRDYAKDRMNNLIRIIPFYYLKEVVCADIPAHLTSVPGGFEFSFFNLQDIEAISDLEERKDYIYNRYVFESFERGDTCLGIKYQGKIAAFTWYSLKECRSWHYPVTMKENEAYLYDMYVLKAYRGHNLAPILRYRNYEVLRELGRNTFYSITDYANTASLRFKQKLGARIVFLGLCIVFRNNHAFRWILRRYS